MPARRIAISVPPMFISQHSLNWLFRFFAVLIAGFLTCKPYLSHVVTPDAPDPSFSTVLVVHPTVVAPLSKQSDARAITAIACAAQGVVPSVSNRAALVASPSPLDSANFVSSQNQTAQKLLSFTRPSEKASSTQTDNTLMVEQDTPVSPPPPPPPPPDSIPAPPSSRLTWRAAFALHIELDLKGICMGVVWVFKMMSFLVGRCSVLIADVARQIELWSAYVGRWLMRVIATLSRLLLRIIFLAMGWAARLVQAIVFSPVWGNLGRLIWATVKSLEWMLNCVTEFVRDSTRQIFCLVFRLLRALVCEILRWLPSIASALFYGISCCGWLLVTAISVVLCWTGLVIWSALQGLGALLMLCGHGLVLILPEWVVVIGQGAICGVLALGTLLVVCSLVSDPPRPSPPPTSPRAQTQRTSQTLQASCKVNAPPNEVVPRSKEVLLKDSHLTLSNECAICCEPHVEGSFGLLLSCRHVFHKDCIQPWLAKHNTCPVCRQHVV